MKTMSAVQIATRDTVAAFHKIMTRRNHMTENQLDTQTLSAEKPYNVFNAGPLICKTDVAGLEFDFNYGARVKVPEATGASKSPTGTPRLPCMTPAPTMSLYPVPKKLRQFWLGNLPGQ
ncbi:MAG: hypothetical protein ACRDBM_07510 [Sporomusa sp.]